MSVFASTALRLHACRRVCTPSPALTTAAYTPLRHARQQPAALVTAISSHVRASTTTTTTSKQNTPTRYKYPEYLNVYRAGVPRTVFAGLWRAVTGLLLPYGWLCAYAIYCSPSQSNWWVPATILASAVPLALVTLYTGPIVHAIQVRLPTWARSSREDLNHFVKYVPADTELRLLCMRVIPWPTKATVEFGRLRKCKPSWTRGLSNLEWVPPSAIASQENKGSTGYNNALKNLFGSYYVDNDISDRSAAPGLWNKMWKQIPVAGSKEDLSRDLKKDFRPAVMANRPQNARNAPARPIIRPRGGNR